MSFSIITSALSGDRRRRLRVIFVVCSITLGLVMIFLARDKVYIPFRGSYVPISQFLDLLGVLFTIFGFIGLAISYLETGFKSSADDGAFRSARGEFKFQRTSEDGRSISFYSKLSPEIAELKSEIFELKSKLAQRDNNEPNAQIAGVAQVAQELSERIIDASGDEIIARVSAIIDRDLQHLKSAAAVNEAFEESKERLANEIKRLNLKSNFNLAVGGGITVVGLGLLGAAAFYFDTPKDSTEHFVMAYAPRLSLVILLQIFAFFFLKLYKSSLEEVKYYQNEITNVEHRQAALSAAFARDELTQWGDILNALVKVERNRLLEKGQSTIDIEHARIEANGGALDAIMKIMPLLKK